MSPRRHSHAPVIWGIGLVLAGIVGAVVVLFAWTPAQETPTREDRPFFDRPSAIQGDFDSNGERIYYTGVGEDGVIPRTGGMGRMASGGCVACHGADGQGRLIGMMGTFETPPITYEALTGAHEEHDDAAGADADEEHTDAAAEWDERDIARAIREGIEPDGEELNPIMPRWNMDDADMADLIEYLEVLGEE